jgi:hypothetical protein
MAFGTTIDPGDIESPLVLLNQVIDATWTEAGAKSSAYTAKVDAATGSYLDIDQAPQIADQANITAPTVTAPAVDIPATVDDSVELYKVQYQEMMDELTARMTVFIGTHFPDESAGFAKAQEWLQDALDNPEDSGIPAAVRDAVFEDERTRILSDAERAKSSVLGAFASRGFPLPPGQAAGAIIEIERKAQGEIAGAARALAKIALDFQQFSVQQLLGLRQSAMTATLGYIQTLATSPGDAVKITNMQSELIRSAADFYRAEIAAAELKTRVDQFNATSDLDVATKNQAAKMSVLGEKAKALMTDAQGIAQMATALYNNLNASVGGSTGYSGSVNHNWSYEGN